MTTVAGVELNRLGFCDSFVKGKEKRTNQQLSNWTKGPLNGGGGKPCRALNTYLLSFLEIVAQGHWKRIYYSYFARSV